MKLLYKLERKIGKYAIPNLIKYIIILYALGLVISPQFYFQYLSLDIPKILGGQIWRVITFIMYPRPVGFILFLAIELYLYYMIGTSLERAWGTFRFNVYFISGILFHILAAAFVYFAFGGRRVYFDITYINRAMFFAFAVLYPNMQFMLYMLIPVKVKYLAYLYGGLLIYELLGYITNGNWVGLSIVISMANFLIFFFTTRNYKNNAFHDYQRKANFRKKVREGKNSYGHRTLHRGSSVITRHKCTICGKTELDDEQLEFRFCSKCEGNYEYCMEHLFTHEHVKK